MNAEDRRLISLIASVESRIEEARAHREQCVRRGWELQQVAAEETITRLSGQLATMRAVMAEVQNAE